MEIVGADFGAGNIERRDALGFHVDHAVLVLERSFDAQKPAARDDHAVALENVRRNDHIGNAGFVFEREENKALCCAWPLARDDASGNAHESIVAAVSEVVGRMNALSAQGGTMVGHWVRAGGEPSAGVVGGNALVCGHLP